MASSLAANDGMECFAAMPEQAVVDKNSLGFGIIRLNERECGDCLVITKMSRDGSGLLTRFHHVGQRTRVVECRECAGLQKRIGQKVPSWHGVDESSVDGGGRSRRALDRLGRRQVRICPGGQ